MSERPAETTEIHTRLLKCALEVEDARAYWRHWRTEPAFDAQEAFDGYWFGARSLARVKVLLSNFRARFDVVPEAAALLSQWPDMEPDTRRLICHWHLQLSDPLYRRFTGEYLAERRGEGRNELTRDLVVAWVNENGRGRWTAGTRIQFASKLLSSAFAAGLLAANRDPRQLVLPRVHDRALVYLMYLLRGVSFDGTLLSNPYTISVGLDGRFLEERLTATPGLNVQRQGDLLDFRWSFADLTEYAGSFLAPSEGTQNETSLMGDKA